MKLHAAGRPIPRADLPDPPGFAPIPVSDAPQVCYSCLRCNRKVIFGLTCRDQYQHQLQKGLLLQVLQPLQQVQLLAMLPKSREELVEQMVQELRLLEVQHLPPKPLGRRLQPCQFRKNS